MAPVINLPTAKKLSPQPKAKLGAGRLSVARRLEARAWRCSVLQAPRSTLGLGETLGAAGDGWRLCRAGSHPIRDGDEPASAVHKPRGLQEDVSDQRGKA